MLVLRPYHPTDESLAKLAAQARREGGIWSTTTQADARRLAERYATLGQRAPLAREILRQDAISKGRKPPYQPPLQQRLQAHLRRRAREAAIARRISTPTGWDWNTARITDRDPRARMFVIHAEYKHHYSSRESWWTGASYLVGYEDGQWWIERIPRSIHTVAEAVAHITPADVRRARDEGRAVVRQGDVFLVALKRGRDNLDALPYPHQVHDGVLSHPQHGTVTLPPAPAWRAYRVVGTVGGSAD